MTPNNKKTFAALAKPLGFVVPEAVVSVVLAVVGVFRDFGDRTDRQQARLKYLVARWGMPRFHEEIAKRLGHELAPSRPTTVSGVMDHLGWHEQGDGLNYCGLYIENGRIADHDGVHWKAALREICETVRPSIRLTPRQGLLLADVADAERAVVDAILIRHGITLADGLSNLRRWAMACVALPTCPMAITEGERALPGVLDALEPVLGDLGLDRETFTLRMTGCSNGCARPYNADIGLVGRSPGKYAIYLGGRLLGDRIAYLYKEKVPLAEIVPTLTNVLSDFAKQRRDGETLGDFCARTHDAAPDV